MTWRKQIGIVALVSLLLLNILASAAWAQTVAPDAEPTGGQKTAAVFASIFWVPAKTVFCIGSAVSYVGVLALSGGTAYNDATKAIVAGCGGDWLVHAKDIKRESVDPHGIAAR